MKNLFENSIPIEQGNHNFAFEDEHLKECIFACGHKSKLDSWKDVELQKY